MFERYTIASRRAVFYARREASLVGSPVIDTEHLLLGLLAADPVTLHGLAPSLTLDSVREAATRWFQPKPETSTSIDLPLSDEAEQALYQGARCADKYGFSFIRTEHQWMALMAQTETHAAIILKEAGASQSRLGDLLRASLDQEQA